MAIYTDGPIGDEAPLGDFTSSFGYSLGTAVEDAWTGNPSVVIKDYLKYRAGGGSKLDYETARERAKLGGVSMRIPDGGMDADALDMLIERKQDERARQTALARAPAGVIPSTTRFAANLATSMLDPINIASAFVPVVGEARYAGMLARAEGALGRAAVRARVGALEGAVGAALVEPIVYAGRTQLGDDYAMSDSLMNMVVGTALGAGLHTGGGVVGDAFGISGYAREQAKQAYEAVESYAGKALAGDDKRISLDGLLSKQDAAIERVQVELDRNSAAAKVAEMTPEGQQAAMRTAVAQAVEGRIPDVEPVVRLDRETQQREFMSAPPDLSKATDRQGREYDITVTREMLGADKDVPSVNVSAVTDGGRRGRIDFAVMEDGTLAAENTMVAQQFQGAGLAEAMYRAAREAGFDIAPGRKQTEQGAKMVAALQAKGVINKQIGAEPASIANSLDSAKATATRQAAPESLAVGDPVASRAADETIANAPKDEAEEALALAVKSFDAKLKTIEADNPQFAERLRKELQPYDDAVKEAKSLGKAAQAAAVCGMR